MWQLLMFFTVATLVTGAALRGQISTQHAAFVLFGIAVLAAAGHVRGSYSRLVMVTFRVAIPIATVLMLGISLGLTEGRSLVTLATYMGMLALLMGGFYLIVRGLFPR